MRRKDPLSFAVNRVGEHGQAAHLQDILRDKRLEPPRAGITATLDNDIPYFLNSHQLRSSPESTRSQRKP